MARALIVGCGCRGGRLGQRLLADGWAVRGTSRRAEGLAAIEAAGIEPAHADPDRPGSVLELVGDVTVVLWLLGSARGAPEAVAALHGSRLERLLEKLVDTPVRGLVYEAAGELPPELLEHGRGMVERFSRTWRIPALALAADPGDTEAWLESAAAATRAVLGRGIAQSGASGPARPASDGGRSPGNVQGSSGR